MSDTTRQIGRIAFREEGSMWNAYYAMPDTMQDALLVGSIPMAAARIPKIKAGFMALMRDVVTETLVAAGGPRVAWKKGSQSAPEHERGGNA
jgi:hypothetical protein